MAKAEKISSRESHLTDVSPMLLHQESKFENKLSSSVPVARAEGASQVTWEAGHELSVARLDAGLTLAQVASMLKMPVKHIEALEWGNFYILPSQVYVVGYLRLYSRLLHLNEEKVVDNYKRLMAHIQKEAVSTPADVARAYALNASGRTKEKKPSVAVGRIAFLVKFKVHFSLLAILLATLVVLYFIPFESDYSRTSEALSTEAVAPLIDEARIGETLVDGAPVAGVDALKFHFFEPSYLKVQDASGQVNYEKKHDVGDSVVLSGTAPFRVMLEKGTAASILLNSKSVEVPISSEDRPVEFGIAK